MRTTITALVLLFASCGAAVDVVPITGRLSQDDVPYCEAAHQSVIVDSCGIEAYGVTCAVCRAPVGQPDPSACAWDDTTWCVASCDKCPTPEEIEALVTSL